MNRNTVKKWHKRTKTSLELSYKFYARAKKKMDAYLKAHPGDKRSTMELAKEEKILSPLEQKVYLDWQRSFNRTMSDIINEIKRES